MITPDDIESLTVIVKDRKVAKAILTALPIENVQGAGHSAFVERVTKALSKKGK